MLGSKSKPVVNLTGPKSYVSNAGNACSVFFNTDGSLSYVQDGVTTVLGSEWLSPNPDSTEAALYEVQRTQISGTLGITFTGTLTSGTWYPLTSQRGVTATASVSVNRSNSSTYSIRRASDLTVLVSGIQIDVTSNF